MESKEADRKISDKETKKTEQRVIYSATSKWGTDKVPTSATERKRRGCVKAVAMGTRMVHAKGGYGGQIQATHSGITQEMPVQPTTRSMKLQSILLITLFIIECRTSGYVLFWNQFMVEVDRSSIAKISKFNYFLELVKGKPEEDILDLPHSQNGYKLEQT